MSTEIKPGQKVRVRAGELSIYGARPRDYAEVREVEWIAPDGDVALSCGDQEPTGVFHPDSLEFVKRADATPAPLDPSADDALAASLQRLGKVWGEYRDQQVRGAAKALDVVAASIQQVVDAANAAHQPAPEPEPVYEPYALYLAKVHDIPDQRVMWTSDRHHPWMSLSPVASERWHAVDFVTDVRPLVVIDPATVDVDALTTTFHNASHYGVDLPLEGAAYLARVARTFFVGGESR